MKSSRFVPIALLFLLGCSSSTDEGEKLDLRYGKFAWVWTSSIGSSDDIVLWEGEDGAEFVVESSFVECWPDRGGTETINWHFVEADDTYSHGQYRLGLQCQFVGENSIRFVYDRTGETITTSDEVAIVTCLRFNKSLPGGETWWSGEGRYSDPPFPDVLVLPAVMPEAAFEKLVFGCYGG